MKHYRIEHLQLDDASYPPLLHQIKDPPKELFMIGRRELLSSRCVAVVGSRTTTAYGRNIAREIGYFLGSHGITVVSGMASGIDACAQSGALAGGGATIAVLGCGVDVCYPRSNYALMEQIAAEGLLLSEYPPKTPPKRYQFPQRNRIISGLSEALILCQARNRSGALITAELAAEQGREVLAVPGNIDSQYNIGSNKLIRDGATPLIALDDLRGILGLGSEAPEQIRNRLSDGEYRVYDLISREGEMTADEICRSLQVTPGYLHPILSILEVKGFLCSDMGKFYLAKP